MRVLKTYYMKIIVISNKIEEGLLYTCFSDICWGIKNEHLCLSVYRWRKKLISLKMSEVSKVEERDI